MSVTVVTAEEYQALVARVEELEQRLAVPQTQPDWLTVKGAAAHTGLSEHAIRKLIDRLGIDKHQEVKGGRVLLSRSDLDHALTERRTQ
jgi:excisionase family DNA binding protein